jgi:uncharacterized protein YgiM (DUF1202 family)
VTVVSTVSQSANGYTWFNVKANSSGTTGWIATEFLTDGGSSNPTWPAGVDIYVANGPLNLRSGPNGSVVRTVPTGAGATTTGGYQTGGGYGWVSVELDSGEEGWFATDFIAKGSGSNPGTGWPAGTAVFIDNDSLNLRNGPSLGSSVLGVYPYGTNAEILSGPTAADGYNWYRVEVYSNGAVGYFVGEGLSKGTSSPTTDRIRVVDGPVNLRSEPGLNKTILDSLSTGEGGDLWSTSSPTVDGYTWIKIRVDSTQEIGWLATSFINFV